MKINCVSCGHSIELDEAYDDFEGLVKCYVCSGLLALTISDGKIRSVKVAELPHERVMKRQSVKGHERAL